MLEQVCDFVHNYFVVSEHEGTYKISNGTLALPFLLDGQRFRVKGSVINDGIYTYHADGLIYDDDNKVSVYLHDETFSGIVSAMSIPKRFEKIVDDIIDWQAKNKSIIESPYSSESFGGYSYTKQNASASNGQLKASITWRDIFKADLNAYRKIA